MLAVFQQVHRFFYDSIGETVPIAALSSFFMSKN